MSPPIQPGENCMTSLLMNGHMSTPLAKPHIEGSLTKNLTFELYEPALRLCVAHDAHAHS